MRKINQDKRIPQPFSVNHTKNDWPNSFTVYCFFTLITTASLLHFVTLHNDHTDLNSYATFLVELQRHLLVVSAHNNVFEKINAKTFVYQTCIVCYSFCCSKLNLDKQQNTAVGPHVIAYHQTCSQSKWHNI